MPTNIKGWCVHCRGRVETSADHRDAIVECPHCGRELAMSAAVDYRRLYRRSGRWVWMFLALMLVAGLGVLGYYYRTPLRLGFDVLTEETGSVAAAVTCLGLAVFLLGCILFWMVFPLLVFLGLRDLKRRTSELDETTRLCVRHLAQLAHEPSARLETREKAETGSSS